MQEPASPLAVYLHLARTSDLRRQPMITDKLILLAGALAHEQHLPEIAERCREIVLARNPQHLLRKWAKFADAYPSEGFQTLLKQLRKQYSPEKAEHMLGTLGIELGREHELYETQQEYVSALLEAVMRR
jgi:hypothetical protein